MELAAVVFRAASYSAYEDMIKVSVTILVRREVHDGVSVLNVIADREGFLLFDSTLP